MKNLKFNKKFYIEAIKFYFGSVKINAEKYFQKCCADNEYLKLESIALFYKTQSQKSFYED